MREEALDDSLADLLQEYALPDNWRTDLLARLEQDERNERSSTHTFVASAQTRIASLQSKLQRLLDSYLDQDIDRDTYLDKKAELMSEKKSLEEQSSKLTLGATAWVEPMRQWLDKANSICNLSLESDKNEKKVLAKEIFGSNLFLQNKKACSARPKSLSSPPEKPMDGTACRPSVAAHAAQKLQFGWVGRIRTCECWDQNPVPYHLATTH